MAVRREAVERGLVHPDPDREAVLVEQPGVAARREPADLLLGHRQRQVRPERVEQVVGPGVGRDDDLARGDRLAVLEDHGRLAVAALDPRHRGVLAEDRALRRREPPVGDVARGRVREPAVRLEQPDVLVAEAPGRPAPHDLGPVERLERHALGGHRPRVLADVDGDALRGHPRPDVQAAGPEHDLQPALALDLGPRLVGPCGEPDVVAPVVRAADDPAHVLGRAVEVADLVPLQAQDADPRPARRPVGRRGAQGPEPDDDDVPVAAHRLAPTEAVLAEALPDVAADVEAHVLHRRVPAEPEAPRRHAALHALADRPVLAVDEVPEVDGVRRVERGLRDLVGVEQEVDDDEGPVRPLGEQRERRRVVRRQAEHQVRVGELALVADLLVVVEARERRAVGSARHA